MSTKSIVDGNRSLTFFPLLITGLKIYKKKRVFFLPSKFREASPHLIARQDERNSTPPRLSSSRRESQRCVRWFLTVQQFPEKWPSIVFTSSSFLFGPVDQTFDRQPRTTLLRAHDPSSSSSSSSVSLLLHRDRQSRPSRL